MEGFAGFWLRDCFFRLRRSVSCGPEAQMRVFGAESPPFQAPQGRSSRFRAHRSPVIASAAGQSSGSRSSGATQAAARSSPTLEGRCRCAASSRNATGFPFLVRGISGSRALLSFLVNDGAEMMVASTMLPSFSGTPVRPSDPRSPEQQVRQPTVLHLAAEVGTVVLSGTLSRLIPARRRTLSASQSKFSIARSPDYRTAECSARAASPTADLAAAAPCRRPWDKPAKCGLPVAPRGSGHPSAPKKISRRVFRFLGHIQGSQRPIAEGAVYRDPPKKELRRKTAGAPRMHNATPQIRLYSEVP